MPFFDNLSKKVGDAAKTAAKKSGELVEVTKLNMAVNSDEEKIKKIATEIGETIYKIYQEGQPVPEILIDRCLEIKIIEQDIASVKEKIMQIKNMKICPNCKFEVENDIVFCPKCGSKI